MKKSNVTIQMIDPSKLKVIRTNGNLRNVGRFVTLIPTSSGSITAVSVNQPTRNRIGRQIPFFGKGKFGKRPPVSYATVDLRHANDNSNDSGLECDNSNSDSQFWGSAEDLRLIGLSRTTGVTASTNAGVTQVVQQIVPVQQIQSSTGTKLNVLTSTPVEVGNSQPIFFQSTESQPEAILNSLAPASNLSTIAKVQVEESDMDTLTSSHDVSIKNMSPDSTTVVENGHGPSSQQKSSTEEELMKPPSMTIGLNGHQKFTSTNHVKRSRYNFQNAPMPIRPASALKLRNQNQLRNGTGKRMGQGNSVIASTVCTATRDGKVQLQIVAQPEEQHRARYQTEGSRGAIKDRKGNGFPTVKLIGYNKPATLQIFIGSDQGKVGPHMFYQACKVTGKSSTPCVEKKLDGTVVIEIEFEPSKEMVVSCDCVGILKERNVDVEQRFPFHNATSSRKKSTRCRLIFRTTVINSDGVPETLQVSSLPILCTQPPGQPEICKKSLNECYAKGGQELFIIGKNFLKDTKVVVQEENVDGDIVWETKAELLKDYLQQNHLICLIPPYKDDKITKEVECKVVVWSGGRVSESHRITYLPNKDNVSFGASSNLSVMDDQVQTQPMVTMPQISYEEMNNQQQLTQAVMSIDIPSLNRNSFLPETTGIASMPTLVSPTMSTSIVRPAIGSLNFDNTVLTPTTQEERQVVSELQEILDNSSQQGIGTTTSTETTTTNALSLGPTSFYGINLVSQMPIESSETESFTKQSSPVTQAISPIAAGASPSLFSEINQCPTTLQSQSTSTKTSNARRGSNPSAHPFDATAVAATTSSIIGDMGIVVTPTTAPPNNLLSLVEQQTLVDPSSVICQQSTTVPSSSTDSIINCVTQAMKTEPTSPHVLDSPCTQQSDPNLNVMSLLSNDLADPQRTLANALNQLSDNDLLTYINPNCFEQDVK